MNYLRSVQIAAMALVLTACGGGGGGGDSVGSVATATPVPAVTPVPTPKYTPPPADAVSADLPVPTAVPITFVAGSLLISEVSSTYYRDSNSWIEIYNPNPFPVDVSGVKLRAPQVLRVAPGTISSTAAEFALPSTVIQANGYLIVAARATNANVSTSQIAFVSNGDWVPFWTDSGFVELVSVASNATVDVLRFGSDTNLPKTAGAWTGANAPALPYGGSSYGNSLVRPLASINAATSITAHTAAEWQAANFVTPGGQNDVPANALDADHDGIPDSSEVAGSTFAGLDLYAMGVRAGVPDILVEVDYMSNIDEGIKPQPDALNKVIAAFARKGIALHFDAGPNVAGFNLGNSKSVLPFNACVVMGDASAPSCSDIYDLKARSFDVRRSPIFHYAIMASALGGSAKNSTGLAEIMGNDMLVALGNMNLTAATTESRWKLINYQAATIMHELGHNLNLEHGGFEENNYKPNYLSVMNYLYSLQGLPLDPTNANAGQRWYLDQGAKGFSWSNICSSKLEANPCTEQFRIDYSDGSSATLNESALLEASLLGRGSNSSSNYIDWNLNNALNTSSVQRNIDETTSLSVLSDYNDWQNIVLPFSRSFWGATGAAKTGQKTSGNPVHFLQDRQRIANETPIVKARP